MELKPVMAGPAEAAAADTVGVLSPDDMAVLSRVNPAFNETNADGRELLVGYVEEDGTTSAVGIRPSGSNYHDYSIKADQQPGVWQLRQYDPDGNTIGFAQVSRYPDTDGRGPRYDFSVLDAETGRTRFASPGELARQIGLLGHVANVRELAAVANAARPETAVPEHAGWRRSKVARALFGLAGIGRRA